MGGTFGQCVARVTVEQQYRTFHLGLELWLGQAEVEC